LPAAGTAEVAPGKYKTVEGDSCADRGSETILVVEDDSQVRSFIGTILARAGYRVLEANNGQHAEFVVARENQSPHLLLTDVVMPKLGGRRVAERMTERHPEMRVLYMSGYGENAIVNHGVLEPGIQFIAKPITPKGLLRRIREVLAAPGVAAAQPV
jgi:DNA-binding NtrC family response regulator